MKSDEFPCWALWAQLAACGSQLLETGWKNGDSGLGFAQNLCKKPSGLRRIALEGGYASMPLGLSAMYCSLAHSSRVCDSSTWRCCLFCPPLISASFPFVSSTGLDDFHLSIHSDMATIVKAMASPESGLEVRDRMWLKITIPNAFIGKRKLFSNSSRGGEWVACFPSKCS